MNKETLTSGGWLQRGLARILVYFKLYILLSINIRNELYGPKCRFIRAPIGPYLTPGS